MRIGDDFSRQEHSHLNQPIFASGRDLVSCWTPIQSIDLMKKVVEATG